MIQNPNQGVNKRYKTALCKHFSQNGFCQLGEKCGFAHGEQDLRKMDDPLPSNASFPPKINPGQFPNQQMNTQMGGGQQQQFQQQGGTPSTTDSSTSGQPLVRNFKTVKCKYHQKGFCKNGTNCSFAHGDEEVRQGSKPTPNQGQQMNMMQQSGNMQLDPQLANQIAHQQIQYLITLMETHHGQNQNFLSKVKQANELNQSGNFQEASKTLFEMINRQNKPQEDQQAYDNFLQQIQNLGQALYQRLQLQFQMSGGNQMVPNMGGNQLNQGQQQQNQQQGGKQMNPQMMSQGNPQMQQGGMNQNQGMQRQGGQNMQQGGMNKSQGGYKGNNFNNQNGGGPKKNFNQNQGGQQRFQNQGGQNQGYQQQNMGGQNPQQMQQGGYNQNQMMGGNQQMNPQYMQQGQQNFQGGSPQMMGGQGGQMMNKKYNNNMGGGNQGNFRGGRGQGRGGYKHQGNRMNQQGGNMQQQMQNQQQMNYQQMGNNGSEPVEQIDPSQTYQGGYDDQGGDDDNIVEGGEDSN